LELGFEPSIFRDEPSGLQARIAVTGCGSLCVDEKLTAFMELDPAIPTAERPEGLRSA
jgi:hypothetical protein